MSDTIIGIGKMIVEWSRAGVGDVLNTREMRIKKTEKMFVQILKDTKTFYDINGSTQKNIGNTLVTKPIVIGTEWRKEKERWLGSVLSD